MSGRIDPAAVREAWDGAADAYVGSQAAGRDYYRYEFFGPAQAALCGDVAGARVLDVACGGGYFAREMARRGARVTGVDIAPRMIAHARRVESESPLGIAYDVCAAESLADAFAPGAFDVATCCVALQDMPDPAAALRAYREPRPSDDAVRARPELDDAARVPYYAMFDLAR